MQRAIEGFDCFFMHSLIQRLRNNIQDIYTPSQIIILEGKKQNSINNDPQLTFPKLKSH